jgi:hypothetical protein
VGAYPPLNQVLRRIRHKVRLFYGTNQPHTNSVKMLQEKDSTISPDTKVSSVSEGDYRERFCAGTSITCQTLSPRLQPLQKEMDVYNCFKSHVAENEGKNDSTSKGNGDELAVKISKETKPMLHLLRLLKEMDYGNDNEVGNDDPKGRAVTSLIDDFKNEVSLIEHRIKDQYSIMNGVQPPLPPDWIALEDMHSGDIYYANEATGKLCA